MKVNKHGDITKKRTHKFKCCHCGCKYTADNGEWYYSNGYPNVNINRPSDYVAAKCPECDKPNSIQWRGKLRDQWKEYRTLVFCTITLLSMIFLFIFACLESGRGTAILGTIFIISGIITYFISEM